MTARGAVLLTALIGIMGVTNIANAQAAGDGSIRGAVLDAQGGGLVGASITAVAAEAPEVASAVSTTDGSYRLLNLAPGTYAVTVELNGFRKLTRDNVVVRAGLNVAVDLTLELGSIAESVQVRADTPMLEVHRPSQSVNVTGEFQQALPTSNRRNWSDVLLLTPGTVIVNRGTDTGASSEIYVHGADLGSNVIQLDGVDIGSIRQGSTRYHYLTASNIEDTQVSLSGTEAAAPLGAGAVINLVTKSGTNTLRGSLSLTGQRRQWTDSNVPRGTSGKIDLIEPAVSAGGPLVRDRAWYFGSYQYTSIDKAIVRTPQQVAALQSLAPERTLPDLTTTNHQTFAKVSLRASRAHWIDGFVHSGVDEGRGSVAFAFDLTTATRWGGHSAAAQWRSTWSDAFTTRAAVSYNDSTNESRPLVTDQPRREVYRSSFLSAGRRFGNTLLAFLDSTNTSYALAPSEKVTVTFDGSYFLSHPTGSHELRAGVYLMPRAHSGDGSEPANNGFVVEQLVLRDPANPGLGYVPFRRQIVDPTMPSVFNDTRTSDYAVYIQDSWHPTPRVTVHGGVRVDVIDITDRLVDQPLKDTTAVGARVGASVLLTRDGKNVARGSWGRIHDSVTRHVSGFSLGVRQAASTDQYDLDLDGTFETTFTTPATMSAAARRIDLEGFRQPHVDEWTVGYQRQLPGQTAIDIGVMRRNYRNQATDVEVNGIYENGRFLGYRDEAFDDLFVVTSNAWNWPVYTAVSLTASKRTSRLELIGSYTRQFEHLTGTWQPNDISSILQPDAFPDDKVGGRARRDHLIAAGAVYRGPGGISVATNFNLQSGQWSGPITLELPEPDPAFGPPTLTLSNGRVVSNPLATTTRFAFPTRGEGQRTGQWVPEWNLRIGHAFRAAGATWGPAIDVLNVVNTGRSARVATNSLANATFGTFAATNVPPRAVQASLRVEF